MQCNKLLQDFCSVMMKQHKEKAESEICTKKQVKTSSVLRQPSFESAVITCVPEEESFFSFS